MGLFKRKSKALDSVPSASPKSNGLTTSTTMPSTFADTTTQADKEAALARSVSAASSLTKPVDASLPPQASTGLEPKPSFASDTPAPAIAEASTAAATPAEPTTAPTPPAAPLPPAKYHLTLDQICQGAFVGYILFQLLLFKLFRPAFFTTCVYITLGFGVGMGLSFLFYSNKRRKRELNEVLSEDPGVKGMECLLKEMPSWVSYTDTEKMEWMNRLLHELWPHYDRAICQTVKDVVEPMIAMYCPPTFKRIFFKHLTFGDAPFRIESMRVEENRTDEVVMEVGVRWCGDANITIGVDLPAGGDATRMCPKVSDISFVGTARVALKPLCNTIPGFGGIMVSLKKPPIVKFKLDFGKALGSGYTAGLIRQFLDPLIRSTMVDMLVWPQRIVSPVIWGDPAIDAAIEKMMLRHVGVMRVTVDRCRNLNSYDMGGKSDPIVELCIDPLHRPETKCVKNNLNPEYGETFFLLVQEPTDQMLRITVSDVDMINVAGAAKDLLSINFVKGITSTITNSVNHKTFMGRSAIQIREICQQEGREVPGEYPLGRGDWSDLNGPGKGEGTVHLTCTYKSFPTITVEDIAKATKGILLVDIKKVADLELASELANIYAVVKVGKIERRTQIVRGAKKDFSFGGYYGSRFVFYDVDIHSDLKIKLREYTMLGSDDSLGKIEPIPIAEIAESKDQNEPGFYLIDDRATLAHQRHGMPNRNRCQLTEVDHGRLYAEVRFVPHFELGSI